MPTVDPFSIHWPLIQGLKTYTRTFTTQSVAASQTIVMIHGLGVSGEYLVPAAKSLAGRYNVIIPDLPGFGRSDNPEKSFSISEFADFLVEWMQAVGIQRPTLLGNSLGCQVIVDLAMRYPDRLDQLILVAPTVDRVGRTIPRQLGRAFRQLWKEPWSLWPILFRDYLTTGTLRMWHTLQMAVEDQIEKKLPRVKTSTLIACGTRDLIAPRRWCLEVAELLPTGKLLIIQDGTHALHFSKSTELIAAVDAFLVKNSER
jgi:2-hydroxy-6-oxonona-2,4-dienedioate hydrolase